MTSSTAPSVPRTSTAHSSIRRDRRPFDARRRALLIGSILLACVPPDLFSSHRFHPARATSGLPRGTIIP